MRVALILAAGLLAAPALADENIADQYPDSALYQKSVYIL